MSMRNRTILKCAATLAMAAPVAACSGGGDNGAQQEIGNETLAAALAGGNETDAMSDAMQETGLAQVFDGTAAYTVLAPSDDALEQLAEANDLNSEEGRALLAAILREHVLPGALTPDDIENAITLQDGDVSIQTMGDSRMRFAMEGGTLKVTDENGQSATVSGDPILASNGVVIPIDAVLKTP